MFQDLKKEATICLDIKKEMKIWKHNNGEKDKIFCLFPTCQHDVVTTSSTKTRWVQSI